MRISVDRISVEEARKMVGTEFTYYDEKASVRAYVKAFDPEIGLTCETLETRMDDGYSPKDNGHEVNDDGTWCVIAYNFKRGHSLEEALETLQKIRDTGVDNIASDNYGLPSCAF